MMVINLGEECSFGQTQNLQGSVLWNDCQGEWSIDKLEHLLVENFALSNLTLGGARVTTDGSFFMFLTGMEHMGKTFAWDPN